MGIERRGPPGTLRMDPSGRPHRGAPCTEETPLRTEEPRAARRSQPRPHAGASCGQPAAAPTPSSCRSPSPSSWWLLIPHTGGAWEPLRCPTSLSASRHCSPGPQPQFPRTLGQTRSPGFLQLLLFPSPRPPGQGPECPFPCPQRAAGRHSQAQVMVTHPESGVFGNISDLDTQGRKPSSR